MENLGLKNRIAVLWIFLVVALLAQMVMFLLEPGAIETIDEMWAGSDPAVVLPVMGMVFGWVPLVMAFLSVTLKDSANRWANMILGIVFTILNIVHLSEYVAQPTFVAILFGLTNIVVTALIFWYAYKWPKET